MQVVREEHSMLRGAFAKRLSVLFLALLSWASVMLEPSLRTAAVRGGGGAGPWCCPDPSLNSNASLSSWVTGGEVLNLVEPQVPHL